MPVAAIVEQDLTRAFALGQAVGADTFQVDHGKALFLLFGYECR